MDKKEDEYMSMQVKDLDVRTIIQLLHKKEVSPVELVEAYVQKMEEEDEQINAWVSVQYEEALQAAKEAEKNLILNKQRGVLEGIPFAAKDNIFTRGIETSGGSKSMAGFYPEQDTAVLTKLTEQCSSGESRAGE